MLTEQNVDAFPASLAAPAPSPPVSRASRLGITSFLMALGFPALLGLMFAISLFMQGRVDAQKVSKFDSFTVMGLIIGGPIVHFVGLVLGIAGAFQKQRKKLFPILGIVLNGLLVLIAAIICILALSLIVASLGRVT